MTPLRFSQRWQALRFWLALFLLATCVLGGAATQAAFLRPAAAPTPPALPCSIYLPIIQSFGLLANQSSANAVSTSFTLSASTCPTPGGATPTKTPATTPTKTPATTPTTTPTPVTPTAVPPAATGLVGFATVNALGQNGTTGGAGGATVTVTTASPVARLHRSLWRLHHPGQRHDHPLRHAPGHFR